MTNALIDTHILQWRTDLDIERSGTGRNKLRTYNVLKANYEVKTYCKLQLPYTHRSALAKFRCGVAPLRLETGRYERLPESERVCPFCKDSVENEIHVLLNCPTYSVDRNLLFEKAVMLNTNFELLNDSEKFKFLFTHPEIIRTLAKTCCNILKLRNNTLYSRNVNTL